jgi:hypothetical protein
VFEFRVTKYDPAYRDESGAYQRDEWTAFSDIGKSFNGDILTQEEYQRVEDAYVSSALSFLREAGRSLLVVVGLENNRGSPLAPLEGSVLQEPQLGEVIRNVLREKFWCRLEGDDCFLHFGWDYYVYIGVPLRCEQSRTLASRLGLFVEEFASPYKEQERSEN